MSREGGCRESHDSVTDLEVLDRRPNLGNATGAFETERRTAEAIFQHVVREHAQAPHQVAEIETCCLNHDLNFAGARTRAFERLPSHAVPTARLPLQPRSWRGS